MCTCELKKKKKQQSINLSTVRRGGGGEGGGKEMPWPFATQFGGSTHPLNFYKFRDTRSSFNWAKYQQLTHFKGLNRQRDVVFLRWKRVLLSWCTAHFLRRGKHDNKWNILVQFNNFTVVYSVKLRRLTNRKRTRRESPLQNKQEINKKSAQYAVKCGHSLVNYWPVLLLCLCFSIGSLQPSIWRCK